MKTNKEQVSKLLAKKANAWWNQQSSASKKYFINTARLTSSQAISRYWLAIIATPTESYEIFKGTRYVKH